MACPIRLQPGQDWSYKGVVLTFERELGDRQLQFTVQRTLAPFQVEGDDGELSAPDWDWAFRALAEGTLRRLPSARSRLASMREAAKREYAPEDIAALDSWAQLRHLVLNGLDSMRVSGGSDKTIAEALSALKETHRGRADEFTVWPAPRTVRRWLKDRGAPGERQLRYMVAMRGKVPRKGRLDPCQKELTINVALEFWATPRQQLADAHAALSVRIWDLNADRAAASPALPPLKVPSRETLRQTINALECRETYAAKWGQAKADARFKGDGMGLLASRFLQLGLMDHTWFDAVAVFDDDTLLPLGRPTLTVLMDVRTRCILAFVICFEPPSLYQALQCVIRANRPKPHLLDRSPDFPVLGHMFGRFDEIIVDNGWEFAGKSFEDALGDAGVSVRWAPIKSPTYKAMVERFFGTLNGLLRKAPGGVLKPELLRELDYDPYKDAVLTLAEFEDLIWDALKLYHIDVHAGVGRPPADLWQEDMQAHGIDIIADDSQVEKMAGQMKYPCTLTKSGVRVFGLQFHDTALTEELLADLIAGAPIRGQRKGSATAKVKIKFNPASLAQIHVWNERRNVYVTLPCRDDRYAGGVSLWQHTQIRKWAKEKGLQFSSAEDRLRARHALTEKIEALAPELKIRQRKTVARLRESPIIQERLASKGVTVALAPSRHDGLAPIIPHSTLASVREDGSIPPTRPARGGSRKKNRRSIGKQRAHSPPRELDAPETDADGDDQVWGDFE